MSHNTQKKIAVINDITGFGRCSMSVILPVISALKVQCCPVPTAILSNHTEFPHFFLDDYTGKMQSYIEEWKKLGLVFQGISTGYLSSKRQIDIIIDFIDTFRTKDTIVVIDPVMGDNGKPYPMYEHELCLEMKRLASFANLITPNVTEACILTDTPYKEIWTQKELLSMAEMLSCSGPEKVVITGIVQGDFIANLCYEKDHSPHILRSRKIGAARCGTGDIFTAVLAADAVNGVSLCDSVKKASRFIKRCIQKSIELTIPTSDGVCFEEVLHTLRPG